VELDRQSVSTAAAVESRIAAIGIGPGLDWDSTVVRPLNRVAKFQSIQSRSTRQLRQHACPTRRFPPPTCTQLGALRGWYMLYFQPWLLASPDNLDSSGAKSVFFRVLIRCQHARCHHPYSSI
jgi:hypothetical protein